MRFPLYFTVFALISTVSAQQDPALVYDRSVPRGEFLFVATDPSGDVIAVGRTNNAQFAVHPQAVQPRFGGGLCANRGNSPCYDVVAMRFRGSDGAVLSATFLGGSGDDIPTAMAIDAQGWVYIAGTTSSRNFPRSEGAFQDTNRSQTTTGFVAKLHGSLTGGEFATYLGGNAPTRITAIAPDHLGNTYVTGTTDALDYPATPGAYLTTIRTPATAFVTKLNNGGRSMLFSTFLGAGTPSAIATDRLGNAVIAGTVNGAWPVTGDAFQATRRGGADLFFTRLLSNGTLLDYSTYIGGAGNDQALDLALDSTGNAYIAGVTYSSSFPGTTEALGEEGIGFVLKIAGANPAWTLPMRGNGLTTVNSVRLGSGGTVIATGTTNSTHFPTTSGAHRRCVAPDAATSPFYLRIGDDGRLQYSTLLDENATGEKWATPLPNGDVVTLNRPPSPFEQVPASDFRRYSFTATTGPRIGCVISAASYRNSGVTPGMVVTLFGKGMGPAEGVVASLVDGKIPVSLGGVRVLFNGVPAPLLFVREDQINAVAPFSLAGVSTAEVRVEYSGGPVEGRSVNVKSADAGIFRFGSTEFGAVLNEDGSVNTPANPAARGSVVTFWGTGMGPFQATYEDGSIVGANFSPLLPRVRVTVGGVEGQLLYAGASPDMVAGVTQINLRLATNTRVSSRVPVAITLGDTTLSQLAYISVK